MVRRRRKVSPRSDACGICNTLRPFSYAHATLAVGAARRVCRGIPAPPGAVVVAAVLRSRSQPELLVPLRLAAARAEVGHLAAVGSVPRRRSGRVRRRAAPDVLSAGAAAEVRRP